jgi:hypothetical protein
VGHDALDELRAVLPHRRVAGGQAVGERVERVDPALLGLEQDVQRPLARLGPGGH